MVEVPEGTHQYKYFVDGDWRCHPNEVCFPYTHAVTCAAF